MYVTQQTSYWLAERQSCSICLCEWFWCRQAGRQARKCSVCFINDWEVSTLYWRSQWMKCTFKWVSGVITVIFWVMAINGRETEWKWQCGEHAKCID